MNKGLSIFKKFQLLCWISIIILSSMRCNNEKKETPLFEMLDASKTDIQFENILKPSPDFNMFHYMYYQNHNQKTEMA